MHLENHIYHKSATNPNPALHPGLDSIFLTKAINVKKNVGYLETLNEFVSIWEKNCSGTINNSILLSGALDRIEELRNLSKIDPIEFEWEKALANGNILSFENGYKNKFLNSPRHKLEHDCHIVPRNVAWLDKVKKAIKSEINILIIVGAAHLIGKDSLIDLLAIDGYRATLVQQE